jgi:hypothetical protein
MQGRPPDEEVARAIDMTVLCRDLGVLPGSGGLLEQDSYHVWLLQETLAVFREKEQADLDRQKREAEAKARRHR